MQVAKRVDSGHTALFAFRGTCTPEDWGIDSEVKLAVLGTAADLFPWKAIDASARVHAGFLARFCETLGIHTPNGLREQVGLRSVRVLLRCVGEAYGCFAVVEMTEDRARTRHLLIVMQPE